MARPSIDPGRPVRFTKWWRGYNKGTVARFDTTTAGQLVDKKFAIPYRPSKEEAEEDQRRAAEIREAQVQNVSMHQAAMAMRQGQLANIEK